MTSRNRRFPARRRPQRTSRRVWVNQNIAVALTENSIQIIDLLDAAPEFMLFDSTILRVILSPFFFSINISANQLIREVRYALFVGNELLDSADVPGLFTNTVGPPWMHVGGEGALFTAASQLATFDLTSGRPHIEVRAKRRFKENDATLWLAIQNEAHASDVSLRIDGYARTLIHIP